MCLSQLFQMCLFAHLVSYFLISIFLISLLVEDNDNVSVLICCQLHHQKESKNEIALSKGRL